MPDLDNHMDDLFRKAADNYRPAEGESDWDKIAPLLNKKGAALLPPNKNSNIIKNSATLLLLLLLVATGFMINNLIKAKNSPASSAGNTTAAIIKTLPINNYIQPKSGLQDNSNVSVSSSVTNNKNFLKETTAGVAGEMTAKKNNTIISKAAKQTVNISQVDIGEEEYTSVNSNEEHIPQGNLKPLTGQPADEQLSMQVTGIVSGNELIANPTKIFSDTNTNTKTTSKKKVDQLSKQKVFYIGITAGPEFSGVRTLERNPGYTAGIIAGYQLNKKLAIQTGVLFSKIEYTCNGRYFNQEMLKASMPPGMQILSLTGNCGVFEIPLKLNYSIINNSKANVFLSSGFSTYLLLNESNRYKTLLNGDIDNMNGSYKNTTFYPAATADISIGFEKKLSNGNKLRLEPYLQLPLKGIGVGDMKVISTGLHVSYLLFQKNKNTVHTK